MTRDDMLECLRHNVEDLRFARGSDYSGVEAIEMAIKILEAQPPCDLCTYNVNEAESPQDVNSTSKDTIYRQAAIDAICDNCDTVDASCPHYPCRRYTAVEKLPPAQPEIVRCKDCRHGVDYYHDGDCYCSNPEWGLMYFGGSWEFYCAGAERRTEHEHEENLGESRNVT